MYEIYSFFNARAIYDVLNAIVNIMGGSDYLGLLKTVGIIGLLVAASYGLVKARAEEPLLYIGMFAIFYFSIFLPKVQVTIVDPRMAQVMIVSNVPLGIGFIASATNRIGKFLTLTFETNFAQVDDVNFSSTGMMFGAKFAEQKLTAKSTDPNLNGDMAEFVKGCVLPEFVDNPIGHKRLVESVDVWGDIAAGNIISVNPGRIVNLAGTPAALGAPVMSCPMAVQILTQRLNTESNNQIALLARKTYPNRLNANALVISNLGAFEAMMFNSSLSAQDAIRQAVVTDMMVNGSLDKENVAGFQTAAAVAQAQQASKTSYASMAQIAEDALPKLRNIIELAIIALFPVVGILILVAGAKGGLVLKSYVMGLLWVQLWAPIYAVINYLMTAQTAEQMKGITGAAGGINLANKFSVYDTALSEMHIAGMLTLSVPVIAYAIIKGGEMAMSSLASSLMSPASSAAQKAGDSAGLGNMSVGNTSWGNASMMNAQYGNSSGNTQSWNSMSANKWNAGTEITTGNAGRFTDAWGSQSYDTGTGQLTAASPNTWGAGAASATAGSAASRGNTASSEQSMAAEKRWASLSSEATAGSSSHTYGSDAMRSLAGVYGSGAKVDWSGGTGGNFTAGNAYGKTSGLENAVASGDSKSAALGLGIGASPGGGGGGGGKGGGNASGTGLKFPASAQIGRQLLASDINTVKDGMTGGNTQAYQEAYQRLESAMQSVQSGSTSGKTNQQIESMRADLQTMVRSEQSKSAGLSEGNRAANAQSDSKTDSSGMGINKNDQIWNAAYQAAGGTPGQFNPMNSADVNAAAAANQALSRSGSAEGYAQQVFDSGKDADLQRQGLAAPTSQETVKAEGEAAIAENAASGKQAAVDKFNDAKSGAGALGPGSGYVDPDSMKGAVSNMADGVIKHASGKIDAGEASTAFKSGATKIAGAYFAANNNGHLENAKKLLGENVTPAQIEQIASGLGNYSPTFAAQVESIGKSPNAVSPGALAYVSSEIERGIKGQPTQLSPDAPTKMSDIKAPSNFK